MQYVYLMISRLMIQSLLHCLSGTHIRSKSAATPAQSDVTFVFISYKVMYSIYDKEFQVRTYQQEEVHMIMIIYCKCKLPVVTDSCG